MNKHCKTGILVKLTKNLAKHSLNTRTKLKKLCVNVRTGIIPFYSKSYCKGMEAFATNPFFCSECINLKNLQQQLQLFIQYSKFLRRAIVVIFSCKGDFQNNYYIQKLLFRNTQFSLNFISEFCCFWEQLLLTGSI